MPRLCPGPRFGGIGLAAHQKIVVRAGACACACQRARKLGAAGGDGSQLRVVVVSDLRPRCGGRWRWLTRAGAIKARRRPGLPPVRFRLRQRGPSDVALLAVRLRPAPGSHRTGPRFRKWERPHRQTRPPGVQTFRSSRRKPVRVPCPRDAPRTPVVVADSPASTEHAERKLAIAKTSNRQ